MDFNVRNVVPFRCCGCVSRITYSHTYHVLEIPIVFDDMFASFPRLESEDAEVGLPG